MLDYNRVSDPRFIDIRTGMVDRLVLPEGDRLDNVACSPWRDEEGNYQIVGRWSHCERAGASSILSTFMREYGSSRPS